MVKKGLIFDSVVLSVLWCLFALNLWLLFTHFHDAAQQFSAQAISIINGRWDVNFYDTQDMVFYQGKTYWHQGVFPSLILIPLLFVFPELPAQGYLQITALFLSMYLSFALARRFLKSVITAQYVMLALCMGSMYVGLWTFTSSWFYAQVIAFCLAMLFVHEWFSARRFLLLGIYASLIYLTRPTALFVLILPVFYVIDLLSRRSRETVASFVSPGIMFAIPVVLCLVFQWYVNFAKFNDPFFNAYKYNNVLEFSNVLRSYGMFSPVHLPMNIYWYFFASVMPVFNADGTFMFPYIRFDTTGLSLLLVAPFFFYSLRTFYFRRSDIYAIWIAVGSCFLMLLSYFGTGWQTFGPRYAMDAMPLLYILTLYAFQKSGLGQNAKLLVLISAGFNTYLLFGYRVFLI